MLHSGCPESTMEFMGYKQVQSAMLSNVGHVIKVILLFSHIFAPVTVKPLLQTWDS